MSRRIENDRTWPRGMRVAIHVLGRSPSYRARGTVECVYRSTTGQPGFDEVTIVFDRRPFKDEPMVLRIYRRAADGALEACGG